MMELQSRYTGDKIPSGIFVFLFITNPKDISNKLCKANISSIVFWAIKLHNTSGPEFQLDIDHGPCRRTFDNDRRNAGKVYMLWTRRMSVI